jgi:hypothetical protein
MKTIVGILIAATLLAGSGCAKTDWIDRTLVTVDVTGSWFGSVVVTSMGISPDVRFELAQQGSRVTGSLQLRAAGTGDISGPIEGTVAGDIFSFRNSRGSVEGEMTVSGDEMTGHMSTSYGNRPLSLRRVDPSSRQGSPPR